MYGQNWTWQLMRPNKHPAGQKNPFPDLLAVLLLLQPRMLWPLLLPCLLLTDTQLDAFCIPPGPFCRCRAAPLAQEHSTALEHAEPLSPSILLLLFWVIPQFGNLCLQLSHYLPFKCKRKTRENAGVSQRTQIFSKMFPKSITNNLNILTTWERKLTRSLLLCTLLKSGGKSTGKIWKMRYRHKNLWSM